MAELFTSLPRHLYCYVERSYISHERDKELERCVWFGLTSVPGRAWGLSILLESGAIYSALPPNALYFADGAPCLGSRERAPPWSIEQAQLWDCFGVDFALHEYSYLAGRTVQCEIHKRAGELIPGVYLFTAQHHGDAYSAVPEQAKQYHFVRMAHGRLACLPANKMLVDAAEFTTLQGLPKDLKRQTESYSSEE